MEHWDKSIAVLCSISYSASCYNAGFVLLRLIFDITDVSDRAVCVCVCVMIHSNVPPCNIILSVIP